MDEWKLGEKAGGTEAPWQKVWQAASRVVLAACGSLWESVGRGPQGAPGSPREPQGAPGSPREPQGTPREPQGTPGREIEGQKVWRAVAGCGGLCRPVPPCGSGLGSPKQGMLHPGVLQLGSLECCSLAEWSGLEGMLLAVGGIGLDWRLAVF